MRAAGLRFPARRPPLARLRHIRAVLAARISLEASDAFAAGAGWWRSERRIREIEALTHADASPAAITALRTRLIHRFSIELLYKHGMHLGHHLRHHHRHHPRHPRRHHQPQREPRRNHHPRPRDQALSSDLAQRPM